MVHWRMSRRRLCARRKKKRRLRLHLLPDLLHLQVRHCRIDQSHLPVQNQASRKNLFLFPHRSYNHLRYRLLLHPTLVQQPRSRRPPLHLHSRKQKRQLQNLSPLHRRRYHQASLLSLRVWLVPLGCLHHLLCLLRHRDLHPHLGFPLRPANPFRLRHRHPKAPTKSQHKPSGSWKMSEPAENLLYSRLPPLRIPSRISIVCSRILQVATTGSVLTWIRSWRAIMQMLR